MPIGVELVRSRVEPRAKQWTLKEYQRAIETGVFERSEKLELINGEIVTKMGHSERHALCIELCAETIRTRLGDGRRLRVQLPLNVPPSSQPEPDLALVEGDVRNALPGHPISALLVVEVSDTSIHYDRTTKAALYARAGIPEYWIINLGARTVEVLRYPENRGQGARCKYLHSSLFGAGSAIRPLCDPEIEILVDDLLP